MRVGLTYVLTMQLSGIPCYNTSPSNLSIRGTFGA